MLNVTGLKDGDEVLKINGVVCGRLAAKQPGEGVNLTVLPVDPKTPNSIVAQSRAVLAAVVAKERGAVTASASARAVRNGGRSFPGRHHRSGRPAAATDPAKGQPTKTPPLNPGKASNDSCGDAEPPTKSWPR